eukprot:CAMPEP_0195507650 /NCGR_PEP_ID=MMETSP0794_2-20130614/1060_1 /TAXON_ID=515487 /ORGANISM="Stephanopyxis turris, Strain CCMP 815" /LENGTH=135 /DNA_ID=CAMNT_0040634409 /DNA_START=1093 /DNA_END=1500 /DNA_ORIENTATION=+
MGPRNSPVRAIEEVREETVARDSKHIAKSVPQESLDLKQTKYVSKDEGLVPTQDRLLTEQDSSEPVGKGTAKVCSSLCVRVMEETCKVSRVAHGNSDDENITVFDLKQDKHTSEEENDQVVLIQDTQNIITHDSL